jgi:hypothetical protein
MNKNPNLEGVIMFQMTIQAINVPDEDAPLEMHHGKPMSNDPLGPAQDAEEALRITCWLRANWREIRLLTARQTHLLISDDKRLVRIGQIAK